MSNSARRGKFSNGYIENGNGIEASSNPILKEPNVSCEEDADSKKVSAGIIYSKLPEISSKLDRHDGSLKFNQDLTELETLRSSVKDKFQGHIGELSLSKEEEQNRIHESKAGMQHKTSKAQALIDEVAMLPESLSGEKDDSLRLPRETKLLMIQKLIEIENFLMINFGNLETNNKDIPTLKTTPEKLSSEISQIVVLNKDKVEESKREIIDYKIPLTKLSVISTNQCVLSDRKATVSSTNTSKINVSTENELMLEKSSSENDTELEQFKVESNKMCEEIDELMKKCELLIEEEEILLSKNNDLKEKQKILTQANSNARKNKNELETTLNVDNEEQSIDLEENIHRTNIVLEELDEEIIKEKGKETQAYSEIEKEN